MDADTDLASSLSPPDPIPCDADAHAISRRGLLIAGAVAMTIWVLALNGFSLNTLLESAVAASTTNDFDPLSR